MDLKMFPSKNVLESLVDSRYIGRKPIYEFLKKNADRMKGTLLDYGAGKMPYKDMFMNAEKYIGLDYGVTASSAGYYKEDILYYDGVTIPLENETVDSILCNQVLEHVDDVDVSLNEIHRVLRRGGGITLDASSCIPSSYGSV